MKKLLLILILGFGLTAFSQDSTNAFDYNYKKGMEHYNKGVDKINNSTLEAPPDVDSSIVAAAKIEFNKALPFLLKAYSINPKNEKVLIALQGVYFSLNDFEKSDRYKKELESLKKKN